MFAAAFFKIIQNAAVELEEIGEAGHFQQGRRFFATNAAGAKGDDRFEFQVGGQAVSGGREFAEMIETEGASAAEGAQPHFVDIAGVEHGNGAALVEPLLELAGCEPGRGAAGGTMPETPKAMISFLIFTSIRLNG